MTICICVYERDRCSELSICTDQMPKRNHTGIFPTYIPVKKLRYHNQYCYILPTIYSTYLHTSLRNTKTLTYQHVNSTNTPTLYMPIPPLHTYHTYVHISYKPTKRYIPIQLLHAYVTLTTLQHNTPHTVVHCGSNYATLQWERGRAAVAIC